MNRKLQVILAVTLAMAGWAALTQAQATGTGSVCVITYQDANRNGIRDPGEEPLHDINVNLMVDSNVVVANVLTAQGELACFDDLPAQQYTLSLSSPFYEPLDPAPVTFVLSAGDRLTHEFGAVPSRLPEYISPSETILHIPLTVPVRLGMSALAALGMMALFAGLGLVIYGIFLHRRFPKVDGQPDWAPLPPWEAKPGTASSSAAAAPDDLEPADEFDVDFDDDFDEFGDKDRAP